MIRLHPEGEKIQDGSALKLVQIKLLIFVTKFLVPFAEKHSCNFVNKKELRYEVLFYKS